MFARSPIGIDNIAETVVTLPAYYATAIPMIQTIPVTVAAKPGILYPDVFAHYVPDLRDFPVNHPWWCDRTTIGMTVWGR